MSAEAKSMRAARSTDSDAEIGRLSNDEDEDEGFSVDDGTLMRKSVMDTSPYLKREIYLRDIMRKSSQFV